MSAMPDEGRRPGTHGRTSATISGAVFAGVALTVSGPLSILQGATGIAGDTVFSPPHYAYRFDLTSWGWIHLVVGVALFIAGIGVLLHKPWARGAGIAMAAISLITQFMFIPYYPVWSIIVMVFDLLIVWALARTPHLDERSAG